MPRTSVVECPGCPPIRALTADQLGLIKVVESRAKPAGVPKLVDTWGSPEASHHVLFASMADHEINPIMAIARKNGLIELLNPLNGDAFTSDKVAEAFPDGSLEHGSALASLHLFRKSRSESGSNTLLMCTEKGKSCLRSINVSAESKDSANVHTLKSWEICCSGNVLCSSVDGPENHAMFAGKGIEVNLWDLDTCSKIWTAKSPPSNSLGIFTPTWFTASTFLCKDDHRKIVAGTNSHQARLYDISAQRRPVLSVDFRESPIRAITNDPDGHSIYLGTGKGDLASFDMRTGKMLGCFLGKCSGSIRSIARHPELPIIASCGLDRYLRFWDTNTRQLLSAVFLKQILTNVMLDTNFSDEVCIPVNGHNLSRLPDLPTMDDDYEVENVEESERSEPSAKKAKKTKKKKKTEIVQEVMVDDVEGDDLYALKPQSPLQEKEQCRRPKHKKRRNRVMDGDNNDDHYEL